MKTMKTMKTTMRRTMTMIRTDSKGRKWASWMLGGIVSLSFTWGLFGCSESPATVVVYTSVDDVFARPVAERFERETDIRVRLVPDTEETKSTGLLNRLITPGWPDCWKTCPGDI